MTIWPVFIAAVRNASQSEISYSDSAISEARSNNPTRLGGLCENCKFFSARYKISQDEELEEPVWPRRGLFGVRSC
jgi:hypothetical protein